MLLQRTILLACLAMLSGCGYEENFEYQAEAALASINASGVTGTVVIGYGIKDRSISRLRIVASGLVRDAAYEVRFFDAKSCEYADLANAIRVDGKIDDPVRQKEAWGFHGEQRIVADNMWGSVEKDFALAPPRATGMYLDQPDKYPAVVVYALGTGQSVACATFASRPQNTRPHM